MIRSLLAILFLLVTTPVFAEQEAGHIARFEGNVTIHRDGKVRGEKVRETQIALRVGDSVRTKRRARAYIQFIDGSKIVLQENSSMLVKTIDKASVDQGTVLFEIKKRGRAKGLQISAATVTMGVRGTRFAVNNETAHVSIFLKNGELEIGTLEGQFKRQKESMEQEFQAMQKKMKDDFENTQAQMKAFFDESSRQMQQGNFEYVKTFNMQSGSAVAIAGNEVVNIPIPKNLDEAFNLLDSF